MGIVVVEGDAQGLAEGLEAASRRALMAPFKLTTWNVEHAADTLARAEIRLACIGRDGRPRRMPGAVREALRSAQSSMEGKSV